MKINNSSFLQKAICIVVSFIQSMLLVLLAGCLCLLLCLSPEFTSKVIKKSDYVGLAVTEMKTNLNDLAIPAGLPSNFFDDKFLEDDYAEFEELLISKATSSIEQKEFSVDTASIKLKFQKLVEDYATEHLGSINSVSSDAVALFVDECTTTYISYLTPDIFNLVFPNFAGIGKLMPIASGVSSVIILLAFIFLFKLSFKKGFYGYCFASFAGAGLILGTIPAYLLITNKISEINISLKSLYSFICKFSSSVLNTLVIASCVLILLALILLALEIIASKESKKDLTN